MKTCENGHRQTRRWKAELGCGECEIARLEGELAAASADDRRRWAAELGPAPAEMVIRTGDGKALVFGIGRPGRRR